MSDLDEALRGLGLGGYEPGPGTGRTRLFGRDVVEPGSRTTLFGEREEEEVPEPTQVEQPEPPTVRERIGSAAGATLEFGLGLLEPVQMPQDITYAIIAGWQDDNRSVTEYLRDLDWSAYRPFGEEPRRPTSGSEILENMGVTNETARGVGGFVMDLTLDPLNFFLGVGAAGAALKGVGLTQAGDDLIRVARNGDDYLSLIPITRQGKTRSLQHLVVPTPIRENMEGAYRRVFETVFGSQIPGLRGETLGDVALSRSVALRAQFGEEVGQQIFRAGGQATQEGQNVREYVLDSVGQISELLGDSSTNWWRNLGRAIGLRRNAVDPAQRFTGGTRDAILTQVGRLGDTHGAALYEPVEGIGERAGVVGEFFREIGEAAELIPASVTERATSAVDEAVEIVRDVARRNGDNVARAEQAFRESLRIVTQSDALVGYYLSMYGPVKENVLRVVGEAGLDGSDFWRRLLRFGMAGTDLDQIRSFRNPVTGEIQQISEVFGEGIETATDILQRDRFFQQLDLPTYLRSLQDGHLRRSFAAFMDDRTFKSYMESLESGRLFPSNILDENNIVEALTTRGFEREGDLIRRYMEGLTTPSGQTASIVPRARLLEHLIDQGVPARRANESLDALIANSSVAYGEFINKARTLLNQHRQLIVEQPRTIPGITGAQDQVGRGGLAVLTGDRAFTQEREALTPEVLELLGELVNPLISIEESSRWAAYALPQADYLRQLYNIAEEYNLVSREFIQGMSSNSIGPQSVYGPFAGMYVHPHIEKEINRALSRPEFRNQNLLERTATFIRGGLLAGPNILINNIAGGLATSTYLGLNPFVMVQESAGVLRDMLRRERGEITEIADIERLRQFIPLQLTRMGEAATVERGLARLQEVSRGLNPTGLRASVNAMGDIFRTFIDNPAELLVGTRGSARARVAGGLFGLQGFTTSEVVMKVSAWRAALRQGFSEAEAAEMARLAVFDYSELPTLLDTWRRRGILMFPGFSYFIAGRTAAGALRRPGFTAMVNRFPDAIMDAQLDDEEKNVFINALPDWLQQQFGIPIGFRTNANGDVIAQVFPAAQTLPGLSWTESTFGPITPFAESAAQIGLIGPALETLYATLEGTGEAPFSARYGLRVFEQGSTPREQLIQTIGFLYNSFSPGTVRKTVSYQPGEGFSGIVPSLVDSLVELPAPFAEVGYSADEIASGRINRTLSENIISATFRSIQPIALTGPYANLQRTYNQALYDFNAVAETLQNRYDRALLRGDNEEAARLLERYRREQQEFMDRWGPVLETYQRYLQRQETSPTP